MEHNKEKEEANNSVSVRTLEDKKIKFGMKKDEFLRKVLENARERKIKVEI